MKLKDLLPRLPTEFVESLLEDLPPSDRKSMLRDNNARVPISAGNLRRKDRLHKEAQKLVGALVRADDADRHRALYTGYLARRAPMIVSCLDAWGVKHQGGIVEDFDWVKDIGREKAEAALAKVKDQVAPFAPFLYFCYLELACTEELFDVPALLKGLPDNARDPEPVAEGETKAAAG